MNFYYLWLAPVFPLFLQAASVIHFNSIECRALDKAFNEFEYCYLKAVNRTYKYFSVKAHMKQIPITDFSVQFAFKKRSNGYKPFIYDVKFDGCKFLSERRNPIYTYFYELFERFSNINHTCPYKHDLIVERVNTYHVERQMTKFLPFPQGDYALFTTWYSKNKPRAAVNIYATVS